MKLIVALVVVVAYATSVNSAAFSKVGAPLHEDLVTEATSETSISSTTSAPSTTSTPSNDTSGAGETASEICNGPVLNVGVTAALTPVPESVCVPQDLPGLLGFRLCIYNNVPAKDLRVNVTFLDLCTFTFKSLTDEASVALSTKQNETYYVSVIGAKDFCDSLKKFPYVFQAILDKTNVTTPVSK